MSSTFYSAHCKLPYMTLGERIKKTRESRGLSRKTFSKAIGVSCAAISQWESGSTKTLKSEHLISAAKELHVEPAWLVTGQGPKDRSDSIKLVGNIIDVPFSTPLREMAILADHADPALREWIAQMVARYLVAPEVRESLAPVIDIVLSSKNFPTTSSPISS